MRKKKLCCSKKIVISSYVITILLTAATLAGAVVSVGSVITYIIAVGKIDAEGVKVAVMSVQDAVEVITDDPVE